MQQEGNEALINAYINNMANQIKCKYKNYPLV